MTVWLLHLIRLMLLPLLLLPLLPLHLLQLQMLLLSLLLLLLLLLLLMLLLLLLHLLLLLLLLLSLLLQLLLLLLLLEVQTLPLIEKTARFLLMRHPRLPLRQLRSRRCSCIEGHSIMGMIRNRDEPATGMEAKAVLVYVHETLLPHIHRERPLGQLKAMLLNVLLGKDRRRHGATLHHLSERRPRLPNATAHAIDGGRLATAPTVCPKPRHR